MASPSATEARLSDVPTEPFGVFEVKQLTRGTALESVVAADWVRIGPGKTSEVHRHNHAETVLWIVEGSGTVIVDGTDYPVEAGSRIAIARGIYHGVRTDHDSLVFLSVQSPPILDTAEGTLDLETQASPTSREPDPSGVEPG